MEINCYASPDSYSTYQTLSCLPSHPHLNKYQIIIIHVHSSFISLILVPHISLFIYDLIIETIIHTLYNIKLKLYLATIS